MSTASKQMVMVYMAAAVARSLTDRVCSLEAIVRSVLDTLTSGRADDVPRAADALYLVADSLQQLNADLDPCNSPRDAGIDAENETEGTAAEQIQSSESAADPEGPVRSGNDDSAPSIFLPCPFCGHQPELIAEDTEDGPTAHMECSHCGATAGFSSEGPVAGVVGRADVAMAAIGAWNKRGQRTEASESKDEPDQRKSTRLGYLNDCHVGPLAEARAIADLLQIIGVDKPSLYDDTLGVLARMLVERLNEVHRITDAAQDLLMRETKEVNHG